MTQQPYPQQYPPQPQQAYPPAPQQPYAPQFPQAPQQAYPPAPPQQQYQPQGYPVPAHQPAPQGPPPAQGTLDDFYNQPSSGGGPSLKFEQLGTRYIGIVARPLGQGDVQQQTDTQGRPLTFRDGRPKWVMKVPLQMQPSEQYPDGIAQWYVKGAARDELSRAMAEAGAPAGAPEAGAVLDITFVSTRPSGQGMNPAKVFQVRYSRPQGSESAPPAQQPEQSQVQQQIPAQPQQQYAQPEQQAPAPQAQIPPVAQPPAQQPQGQPAQQSVPQPPPGLSAEQQALLAQLGGAQQQAS